MSFNRVQRRFHAGVWLCAAMMAAISAASPAFAEATADSRTIIGRTAASRACIEAAQRGDGADRSVEACSSALQASSVTRAERIALLNNRGGLYVRRSEPALAIQDFDAVLALDPDNTSTLFNKGVALIAARQPGPAVGVLTRSLSLGVDTPHQAYYYRGVAREQLGDLRGALEDYSTALEIRPDMAAAEAEIARFARGRHEALTARLADAASRPQ